MCRNDKGTEVLANHVFAIRDTWGGEQCNCHGTLNCESLDCH